MAEALALHKSVEAKEVRKFIDSLSKYPHAQVLSETFYHSANPASWIMVDNYVGPCFLGEVDPQSDLAVISLQFAQIKSRFDQKYGSEFYKANPGKMAGKGILEVFTNKRLEWILDRDNETYFKRLQPTVQMYSIDDRGFEGESTGDIRLRFLSEIMGLERHQDTQGKIIPDTLDWVLREFLPTFAECRQRAMVAQPSEVTLSHIDIPAHNVLS